MPCRTRSPAHCSISATSREPDRFRPWLLSISRDCATDQLRARQAADRVDEFHDELLAATGPGPESLAEMRALADQVQGCVAGLSRRTAAAVTMVTQLGFTPAQVADAWGLPRGRQGHRAPGPASPGNALALQLMVKHPSLACDDFQKLIEDDPLGASKHIEQCETCLDRAGAEVVPFDLRAVQPEASAPRPA